MPLHSGKSKKVVSENIHEMMESKTFGKGKSQKKRAQMAAAAAYGKARKAGGSFDHKFEKAYKSAKRGK